jgi:hypothetical protein
MAMAKEPKKPLGALEKRALRPAACAACDELIDKGAIITGK